MNVTRPSPSAAAAATTGLAAPMSGGSALAAKVSLASFGGTSLSCFFAIKMPSTDSLASDAISYQRHGSGAEELVATHARSSSTVKHICEAPKYFGMMAVRVF